MALYILDDKVRELAAQIAERQGVSVTEAVRAALLEVSRRLERDRAQRDAEARNVILKLRAMGQGPVREEVLRRIRAADAVRFVVDTSARLALINAEPEADRFHQLMLDHEPLMSCGTLIEALRVIQVGLGAAAAPEIDRLFMLYEIEPVPVDREQVLFAREGMLAYGEGRGAEPAALNFGDLFAYALAKQLRLPLLCTGADLTKTHLAAFV
jgi:ribonuclease VapC